MPEQKWKLVIGAILLNAWEGWKLWCVAFQTAIIIGLLIFGGDYHVTINFNKINDFLNRFRP